MRRITAIILLVATAAAWAAPDVGDDLGRRVALTIYNALRGMTDMDTLPADAVDAYRDRGLRATADADGVTFQYRLQPTEIDGTRSIIDARVVMLRPGHEPPLPAEWEALRVSGPDPRTGSSFYRESDDWASVRFRLVRDGVKLSMRVMRPRDGGGTRDQILALAGSYWKAFVSEAERNDLFDVCEIFVELGEAPPAGLNANDAIRSGQVVHFTSDHARRTSVPLLVSAKSRDITDDEPYLINTYFTDRYARPGVTLADENGRDLTDHDGDGRPDITVPNGRRPVRMMVKFDAFDDHIGSTLQETVLDQLAFVRFYYDRPSDDDTFDDPRDDLDDAHFDVRLSRAGGWWPVITRFEVLGRQKVDATHREREGDQPGHVVLHQGPSFGGPTLIDHLAGQDFVAESYNGMRAAHAAKETAWEDVREWARTRLPGAAAPYAEDEAVPMGWRLGRDDLTFITSVNEPGRPVIHGLPMRSAAQVFLELEVITSPPPEPADMPAPDLNDGIGGDDWDTGLPPLHDPEEHERAFRGTLLINDLKLVKRRVGPAGAGDASLGVALPDDPDSSLYEAAVQELDRKMRDKVTVPADPRDTLLEWQPGRTLDQLLPIEDRTKPALGRSLGENRELTVESGIFELQLLLDLARRDDLGDRRKIEVSIRYNVEPEIFDAQPIQVETGRHEPSRRTTTTTTTPE